MSGRNFFGVFLVLLLGCATASAQATAELSGTIADQTGALIPGADVTATQTDTGLTRIVVSNETGSYVLPNLPIGPYTLEVTLPGFRTYRQDGIVLQVNDSAVINVALEVGQVTQAIEVTANTALVETRTVGVGQIMDNERILELPLNGRNASELIVLAGAAVQTGTSSSRSVPGQLQISVAGPPSSAVAYSLDGAFHNNPYDNLSLPLPFPDALQEFKVETSALSADSGRHSGAQVNAVTKSGTNEIHGSIFEFFRNDAFNAADYGSSNKGTLKRNQFGGTIGGPITRNELFFFAGVQFTKNSRDPSNLESFVPTQAMLDGDFTAFAACPEHNNLLESVGGVPTGFVNNRWTGGAFNPVALALTDRLPAAQDECGRVIYGVPDDDSDAQYIGKIDWQINDDHTFIGRYMNSTNSRPVPHDLEPDNLLNVSFAGRDNMTQSFAVGDTWLISPETVSSLHLAWNRSAIARVGANMFNMAELGVQNFVSLQEDYSQVNVAGGFNLGFGFRNDSTFRTTTYSISEDLSLSRGNHQVTLGASVARWESNGSANFRSSGVFGFGDDFTGNGLSDFLTGQMASFAQAGPNRGFLKKTYLAIYAADSWRVKPGLTLNYGLRWEPKFPESLTQEIVMNFSEERRAAGFQSAVFVNAPNGFTYPGDSEFNGTSGQSKNWAVFSPRFGFAWDVLGDSRTSIRGSVGINYDLPNSQLHLWTSISPPWGGNTVIPDAPFEDPWSVQPGGNPFPRDFSDPNIPFTSFGGYLTIPEKLDPPQNQSWNLAVQHQFADDWMVSATYMGSHTIHMLTVNAQNRAIYFPGRSDANGECFADGFTFDRGAANATCSSRGNTNLRRRLSLIDFEETGQFASYINTYDASENASYNGLLLNVRKRAANGVTINANYTWSHCISGFNDNLAVGSTFVAYPFENDRGRSRGNCSSDRRHTANVTGVFATPEFQNVTLRRVASGWQLANIYRYTSGPFISIESSRDRALTGTATGAQPANQILDNAFGDRSGAIGSRYFDRAAFANPASGTFGNAGFRNVAGPGRWQWDVALSRTFQIQENQRIEVRAEAYNVTNSVILDGTPGSNSITSGSFGLVQTRDVLDMRILQFAAKWVF